MFGMHYPMVKQSRQEPAHDPISLCFPGPDWSIAPNISRSLAFYSSYTFAICSP